MKPQGSISVEGEKALIRFRYSPQRFNAIKKVRGALFDREQKVWVVPLGNLPAVTSLPEFNPREVEYKFDTTLVAEKIESHNTALAEAYQRLNSNPFSVSEADIELIQPDVVFLLNDQAMLRAKLGRKSRAKRPLEQVPGAHYIRREQSYFFPAQELHSFLKTLRDKRIRFAVEAKAGERLKRGSLLRSHLLARPAAGSAAELTEAMLFPILDASAGAVLKLSGWTTEQLRDCFPQLHTFSEKKARAASLSAAQAAELLYHGRAKNLTLWISKAAQSVLDKFAHERSGPALKNGFEDSLLALAAPEVSWATAIDGKGGLLVSKTWLEQNRAQLRDDSGPLLPLPDSRFPQHFFLPFRDSKLLASVGAIDAALGGGTVPRSKAFEALCKELEHRTALRSRRDRFQFSRDCALTLRNASLAEQLFPHQRVAVDWLLQTPHGILGDDMGLGKTLSVLTAAEEMIGLKRISRFLIICPNSLVRNWLREGARWVDSLRLITLPREKQERQRFLKRLAAEPHFDGMVVNYETARLEYVYPLLEQIFSKAPGFLCIDESQRIKNPQSKAFQAINDLARIFARRILLTGTPTPKDISDIWGQMMIVDRGERFGTRYYDWLAGVAELGNKYSEVAIKRFIPEQVEETIYRIHEVLLRRRKEEVISLPEKLFSTRDIELSGDQLKRYREICDELLVRVSKLNGDDYIRSIDSVLEQYLRAVQIASNPRLIDPAWSGEPAKFAELDGIVMEVVQGQKGKIVIWTNYLKNVDELVERYADFGAAPFSGQVDSATRQNIVEEFQRKDSGTKVLVAVPGAGGVGITLTAAQTAVYIDKTWNAEHWMQSVNRIHRIGQTGTVTIISLHASKVDELIAHSLRRKEKMQERVLRGLDPQEDDLRPTLQELISALQSENTPEAG